MINLPIRRALADAADGIPWQALSRAIERPVHLPPGADAVATEPPTLPAYKPPARRLSLAIVVPHLMAGGGERTSVLLAKHLSRASGQGFGTHRTFSDVVLYNADLSGDERTFAPYRDELEAAGVPYNSHALRHVASHDVVLRWGRVLPPVSDGQRTVYFVNAPSEAAAEDLRFVKAHVRVDRVVAASAGCARMAERVLEWPTGAASVVWNGAEAAEVDGLWPRLSEGGDDALKENTPAGDRRPFVLGYIGRFASEKNLLSTVAALRLLPEHVRARFVGQGPEPIERAAKTWGVADRVETLPPTGDRRGFYGGIDAFVLPSLYEATPTVVAEAMLAGVPVVASAVGDLPAVLSEGRGFLLDGHGPEAIARAVTEPFEMSPEASRAFSREHLTAERMAAGYEAAIGGAA